MNSDHQTEQLPQETRKNISCPIHFRRDLDLQILSPEHRISPKDLATNLKSQQRHLLVDVRSEAEFSMCHIDGAVNWPIEKLRGEVVEELLREVEGSEQVTFVCRRGNDSQIAAQRVLDGIEDKHRHKVFDLSGGLHAWSKHVDSDFPIY